MQDLFGNLRFALRQLRRNLGFSMTAILTLAIGIAATTAIFSIFYAVLLRPLPFPEPDRLVSVNVLNFPAGSGSNAVGLPNPVSYPDFFDWRTRNHSFESLISYDIVGGVGLDTGSRNPSVVWPYLVSGNRHGGNGGDFARAEHLTAYLPPSHQCAGESGCEDVHPGAAGPDRSAHGRL